MKASDGMQIRYMGFMNENHEVIKGQIVLLQGRASFIEKYSELISELVELGFSIWTFDWRGQGGSSRSLKNRHKVYVDHYDRYLEDLDQFLTEVIPTDSNIPLFFLASSMGAAICLLYLEKKRSKVNGAILLAPMLKFKTGFIPTWFSKKITSFMKLFGLGKMYVFGYGNYRPNRIKYINNKSTYDEQRFFIQKKMVDNHLDLVTSGPTFEWLKATFNAIDELLKSENLRNIVVPILVIEAADDSVVDNKANKVLCNRIKICQIKTYETALHSLHIESDQVRKRLLQDILEFSQEVTKIKM
jgi:lysophospholipase